jgi:Ricin-type beta-trefoil lectin domain-like
MSLVRHGRIRGNNAHQLSNTAKEHLQMSFKTTVARLAGHGGPRAASRTAQRRFTRLPVVVAAAGAVLAGITFAAGPALADTPQYTGTAVLQNQGAFDLDSLEHLCLDANSGQARNFGGIIQWDCSNYDAYQTWAFVYAGNGQYLLKNQGTGFCADADASNAGSYGSIIQWTCNSSDPFQLFYITDTGGGNLSIKSFGASNAAGTPICLDADFYNQNDFGDIMQYDCNTSDSFQLWSIRINQK